MLGQFATTVKTLMRIPTSWLGKGKGLLHIIKQLSTSLRNFFDEVNHSLDVLLWVYTPFLYFYIGLCSQPLGDVNVSPLVWLEGSFGPSKAATEDRTVGWGGGGLEWLFSLKGLYYQPQLLKRGAAAFLSPCVCVCVTVCIHVHVCGCGQRSEEGLWITWS